MSIKTKNAAKIMTYIEDTNGILEKYTPSIGNIYIVSSNANLLHKLTYDEIISIISLDKTCTMLSGILNTSIEPSMFSKVNLNYMEVGDVNEIQRPYNYTLQYAIYPKDLETHRSLLNVGITNIVKKSVPTECTDILCLNYSKKGFLAYLQKKLTQQRQLDKLELRLLKYGCLGTYDSTAAFSCMKVHKNKFSQHHLNYLRKYYKTINKPIDLFIQIEYENKDSYRIIVNDTTMFAESMLQEYINRFDSSKPNNYTKYFNMYLKQHYFTTISNK